MRAPLTNMRLEQRGTRIGGEIRFLWFTKKSCIKASTPDAEPAAILVPRLQ